MELRIPSDTGVFTTVPFTVIFFCLFVFGKLTLKKNTVRIVHPLHQVD